MEEVNINLDNLEIDEPVDIGIDDIGFDEPVVKNKKKRRTKLEMEADRGIIVEKKVKAKYVKSFEQKEQSKRQKNCEYWKVNYGIYIVPYDIEEYLWFKHNKLLITRLLPILDRVNKLKIPYEQKEKS